MSVTLLLAGGGKMGGAMLAGWLDRGMDAGSVTVIEPHRETAERLRRQWPVTVLGGSGELAGDLSPQVVVFAVKPQMMDAVAPVYARFAGPGCVFLSIAAGKTIGYFHRVLGAEAAIVRCMPNTPAAVGRGITVACPNIHVSGDQRRLCHGLLEAVGEVAWVDDEALLDPVTAVSGGGPAYVFLLAECLARAGVEAGLSEELAARLARVTVSGAGELLAQSAEPPEILRKNVTSPGGTTAEALKILMGEDGIGDGLGPLLIRAVAAATKRSRELAG